MLLLGYCIITTDCIMHWDMASYWQKIVCWLHWEGPQLLLTKVKNAVGRIGIFTFHDITTACWHHIKSDDVIYHDKVNLHQSNNLKITFFNMVTLLIFDIYDHDLRTYPRCYHGPSSDQILGLYVNNSAMSVLNKRQAHRCTDRTYFIEWTAGAAGKKGDTNGVKSHI